MSAEYTGPGIGDVVLAHAPLCRVVELAARGGTPGAVITDDDLQAWLPLAWLTPIDPHGRPRD